MLWEIGEGGREVRELRRALRARSPATWLACCARWSPAACCRRRGPWRQARPAGPAHGGRPSRAGGARPALDRLAVSVLDPLSEEQRGRLTAAMAEVERLLAASMVRVGVEDPSPDAPWCMEQYFAELDRRFDGGFDPAASISAERSSWRPRPAARWWPSSAGDQSAAGRSGAAPTASGSSSGCGSHRRRGGSGWAAGCCGSSRRSRGNTRVAVIRLETNRSLTEAIGLYRASGYRDRVQRRALRAPLVREAHLVARRQGAGVTAEGFATVPRMPSAPLFADDNSSYRRAARRAEREERRREERRRGDHGDPAAAEGGAGDPAALAARERAKRHADVLERYPPLF